MREALAGWLNALGNTISSGRGRERAQLLFRLATAVRPDWSVPWYNLGLAAKYSGQWQKSLQFNQRAVELDPQDEAGWWNLAIAATALHDWPEARRAWLGFGLDVENGPGEVRTPHVQACVRLNPQESGEVVWGIRLDPARIMIQNVPLPKSKRRFNDIILNDGVENGTRTAKGVEFPVFDELSVWKTSSFSTFEATIFYPDDVSRQRLERLCDAREIGLEDWSTVRHICSSCSMGSLGPSSCAREESSCGTRHGFAAHFLEEVVEILQEWSSQTQGGKCSEVGLGLLAVS